MLMPYWETISYSSRIVQRHMRRSEREGGLANDSWPPNVDYYGAMFRELNKLNPKPHNTSEPKIASRTIWDKLPVVPD